MPRAARILLVAAALAGATVAQGAVSPPDYTYLKTVRGVKYKCAQWGAPPKAFVVACAPTKTTAKAAA